MYSKTQNSFFSTGDFCRTPGVHDLFPSHPTSTAPSSDRGGIGFMDEIGVRTTDGFVSCTESLGSESSDCCDLLENRGETESGNRSMIWERTKKRSEERRKVLNLPPPLTSFDKNGRRDFILQPVRKDGRLQLTEVRINRPEIMYAARENGRLTLQMVGNSEEEDEAEEEKTEDCGLSEEEGGVDGGEIGSPVSCGEGEAALRRCYEYEVAGQQHMNVWSPRFVTTM